MLLQKTVQDAKIKDYCEKIRNFVTHLNFYFIHKSYEYTSDKIKYLILQYYIRPNVNFILVAPELFKTPPRMKCE